MSDNQNILKLYEISQQDKRWTQALAGIQILATIATPLIIWWSNSRQKKQLNPAVRLIRKRGQIAKVKLRQRNELAELQLDEQTILQEVAYEAQRTKLETGLEMAESKLDLLATLKQKGEGLLKDKVNQVNKAVSEKINQATDKLKVDKFSDPDKIIK